MNRILALLLAISLLTLPMMGCEDREQDSESSTPSSSSAPSSISSPSNPSEEPSLPPEDTLLPPEEMAPPVFSPTMEADFSSLEGLSSEAVTWGPTNYQADEFNRPTVCEALQEKYGSHDAYFLAPNTQKIYLTFDEGYENGYTATILDTLKEKKVPAVFFVTLPYVKSNPELVQRMIDEGHVVGNHSTTHPNFSKISLEEAYQEVKELHDYVKEHFNYTMGLFRYPEGVFTEQTNALLQQMGYQSVFWSFAYSDWNAQSQPDPTAAMEKIQGWSHPGALFLLHAVSSTNDQILPELIDWWRSEGYELASYDLPAAYQEAGASSSAPVAPPTSSSSSHN